MNQSKVFILGPKDILPGSNLSKIHTINFKSGIYEKIYKANVVLYSDTTHTIIIKNRYGKVGPVRVLK